MRPHAVQEKRLLRRAYPRCKELDENSLSFRQLIVIVRCETGDFVRIGDSSAEKSKSKSESHGDNYNNGAVVGRSKDDLLRIYVEDFTV